MIHFGEKFAKTIQPYFVNESVVTNRLSGEYEFSGAKTVKVLTPITVPMTDYTAEGSNRYGDPVEMQDIIQEMTLTQDKAFSLTIDKGNYDDQAFLKSAAKMVGVQMAERAVPMMDTYILRRLAEGAGSIASQPAALTKTTVCSAISAGTELLDDAEVPQAGRTLFVSAAVYRLLKHSDEFLAVEQLGAEALRSGIIGRYDNMDVVKVPKKRLPAFLNFMIVHKKSAVAPVKISETNLHTDPPGISGTLIEGRQYYDCFVFGVKCDGIYVNVGTASGEATVCAAPAISTAGAITCATAGAVIRYTTDGTDPRFSPTAKTGAQSDVTASGTVVRAYACKAEDGFYPSPVSEKKL